MLYELLSRRFEPALKVFCFCLLQKPCPCRFLKRQYKRRIEACVFASHQEAADGYTIYVGFLSYFLKFIHIYKFEILTFFDLT